MQGKIDATCATCGQVIEWDTNCPRLCVSCFEQSQQAQQEAPPDTDEREAA